MTLVDSSQSWVSIAGINVGQLDEVELVEGARVWVRIADVRFEIKSDADSQRQAAYS